MKQVTIKITGVSPILMHADTLSDPLNPATKAHKEVSGKKKKTDDDHLWLARSEFTHSAYFNGRYYLPAHMLLACFVNSAKLNKLGMAFKRALLCLDTECVLDTPVSDTPPDQLFDNIEYRDARTVVVANKRIMRYRPRFNDWSTSITLLFDEAIISESDLLLVLRNAGNLIGIGDYRVERGGGFGRFTVEVLQ